MRKLHVCLCLAIIHTCMPAYLNLGSQFFSVMLRHDTLALKQCCKSSLFDRSNTSVSVDTSQK